MLLVQLFLSFLFFPVLRTDPRTPRHARQLPGAESPALINDLHNKTRAGLEPVALWAGVPGGGRVAGPCPGLQPRPGQRQRQVRGQEAPAAGRGLRHTRRSGQRSGSPPFKVGISTTFPGGLPRPPRTPTALRTRR